MHLPSGDEIHVMPIHHNHEQQLVPDDVTTREEYIEWLRTLPSTSDRIIAEKRPAAKVPVKNVTIGSKVKEIA